MGARWFILVTLITYLLTGMGAANAALSNPLDKVDPLVIEDTADGKAGSFFVDMASQANLSALSTTHLSAEARYANTVAALQRAADQTQPAVTARLDAMAADLGLHIQYQSYWLIDALVVQGTRAVVDALAAMPEVSRITANRTFRVPLETAELNSTSTPSTDVEWNISKVNAPALWAGGVTGHGIVYASADTGVDWTHPALQPSYRGETSGVVNHNYNWWDAVHTKIAPTANTTCAYSSPVPCDDVGHGTHVMGTGVGDGGVEYKIGMAPGAKWIACRNMDNGYGAPSAYIECLQFFVAPWKLDKSSPEPALHADVISNSYACTVSEGCTAGNELGAAVAAVRAAGIFMSVSAGNSGPGCATVSEPPATDANVMTVGSTDINDIIAASSSRGPVGGTLLKPEITAPGVNVVSSVPGGGYSTKSGTSMAAPHVAGAVALLWSAFPALKGHVEETESLLEQNAKAIKPAADQLCGGDSVNSVPNNVYGHGRLDVFKAYEKYIEDNFHNKNYLPFLMR